MADIAEAKKKAIDFLIKSIEEQLLDCWPDDTDPLKFEASSYLVHKEKISKSEWGGKIDEIWDFWEGMSNKKKGIFWPTKDKDWCYAADPNIENHIAMFRAMETFAILGYENAFVDAKKELIENLKSDWLLSYEYNRILWQIVRSPFLRTSLKDPLRAVAQRIIEEKMAIIENKPMVVDEPLSQITPTDIFFLLTTNLEDDHFNLAKSFLNKEIYRQRENGSFREDEVETCLYLCSICLSGIDPNGIVSSPAIAWLMNVQKENGSWQYHGVNEVFNNKNFKGEDIFLTVFVLETLDLLTDDKPLPIWVKNMAPPQPSLKAVQSIGHLLIVPKGIKWGDVSITFISEEAVEIRARVPLGVKNFIELGFQDRRTDKPDYKWGLLKALAQNQGSISWKEKSAASKWKPHIKTLRKRLRELFKIDDDPFHPYRQSNCYRTKFSIAFREEN